MRGFTLLLCATLPLVAADLKIDHVTLAGARLDDLRKAFTAATGIPTEYGGQHANHATEMAAVSFPDGSYFELMGIQAGADAAAVAAHSWSQYLRDNAGPCAFALRVPDVAAELRRLNSVGIHTGGTEKSGRTRPDGVALQWETADVGVGVRGSFFPFLIRDFTPRENRAFPSGKPTTERFRGIGLVVIGVPDLEAAISLYREAFGLPKPRRQRDDEFGANLAWFEGTPVVLASSLAPDSWLAKRVAQFGEAPCAFVLELSHNGATQQSSVWFDRQITWIGNPTVGRLGIWAAR